MKTLSKTIAATALIFAMAAPASASVSEDVYFGVRVASGPDSDVSVAVDGSTVTMTGTVRDAQALEAIEAAARQEGATEVNNLVIFSD